MINVVGVIIYIVICLSIIFLLYYGPKAINLKEADLEDINNDFSDIRCFVSECINNRNGYCKSTPTINSDTLCDEFEMPSACNECYYFHMTESHEMYLCRKYKRTLIPHEEKYWNVTNNEKLVDIPLWCNETYEKQMESKWKLTRRYQAV